MFLPPQVNSLPPNRIFTGGGVRNLLAAENLENNIYSIMYTGSLRIDGAVRSGVTPGAPKTNPLHAPAL